MSHSPRSRDSGTLNFRYGALIRTKNLVKMEVNRQCMSEENRYNMFMCSNRTRELAQLFIESIDRDLETLKSTIEFRKEQTKNRSK